MIYNSLAILTASVVKINSNRTFKNFPMLAVNVNFSQTLKNENKFCQKKSQVKIKFRP